MLLFFVFLLWYGGWAPVLVFLFYPFLESSCLGAPGLAFCQAGGSRLWCVAWCGGCVPSLSGFIGSIVDFTFFVYRDNFCLLFVLIEWAGVFCVLMVVLFLSVWVGVYRRARMVCIAWCLVGVYWFPFLGVLRCNKLWVCFLGIGISDGLSLLPCQCVMHLGVNSCWRVLKINL